MYVTNPTSKTPIFQINEHIGFDRDIQNEDGTTTQGDGQGIDGKQWSIEVLSFNDSDVDKLLFYTNSQGGDVQQSLDMFNAISMSKQKTHSIITGFAFSCAGWIPLAADKVDMVEETGRWMCHMPYDPSDLDNKSQFMDEVVDIISNVIASKSGRNGKLKKTQDQIKALMRETTYWDAERMYNEGLIDNKVNAKGKVIRFEKDPITLNKTELAYYFKENQAAQNKMIAEEVKEVIKPIIEQSKIKNMSQYSKVVNRLNKFDSNVTGFKINITEDASEDVVLETIVRLDNALRLKNDEMMDSGKIILDNKTAMCKMQEDIKDAENNLKEKQEAYDKLVSDNDSMGIENKKMKDEAENRVKEAKDADLKFRKERATNFVEKLVSEGKAKATDGMTIDKVKEYLVNKATDNYEDVALQYSLIPVKISGVKPDFSKVVKNTLESGTVVDRNLITNLISNRTTRIANKQFTFDPKTKIKIKTADGSVVTD